MIPKEAPWTDEQWDAITAGDCNLLVSAAAGAGKTAVLVRRVIFRLADRSCPVDIDRMLVVTFTDAAAAEMRDRIARALDRMLKAEPTSVRLARQLSLVSKADISTIHSFCHRIIKQYFYRIGVDPAFRVMDGVESQLLRLEVADEVFEASYGHPEFDETFVELVDRYGGARGDDSLRDLVIRIHDYSRSRPDPDEWLSDIASSFRIPIGASVDDLVWTRMTVRWIGRELAKAHRKLSQAVELAGMPAGPGHYLPVVQADLLGCSEAIEACNRGSWTALSEKLAACCFPRLPGAAPEGVVPELRERVKDLRNQAKRTVNDVKDACLARSPNELLDDLRRTGPHIEALIHVIREFDRAYADVKQARSLLDFSDLEHLCLQVLRARDEATAEWIPSEVALELAGRYDEIFVDEYQDINPVQDAILRLICRERNSFMVGDVKQSIYRFRLAEPALFMEKHRRFPKAGPGPNRRIDLSRNFRSRTTIVDAVNFIFRQVFSQGVGEIDYDPAAELICGADYPPHPEGDFPGDCDRPAVEFRLIERKTEGSPGIGDLDEDPDPDAPADTDGGNEAGVEDLDSLELEARLMAKRIAEMVRGVPSRRDPEFHVWDRERKAYRPVTYRDIVVLMRATRERANVLLEVFRQADIPAYAELGTGYFEATEVEAMVSLLKIIDNPRQDIPLAGVLRSPICGFSADELVTVRMCNQEGDFYSALRDASACQELGELAAKAGEFLRKLDSWRTMARRVPLSILIWQLYSEARYLDYVGGMPGGTQRQANLRAFHERARQFDRFSRQGLVRFLRFIDQLREAEGDLGTARALGEAEDVVRIMSIHRSKGLEFPVVFVADLGKKFNLCDLRGDILYHHEAGLGPVFCDPEKRIKYPTLAHHAAKEARRGEALAEEMRILYVAMTRAKERLILVGSASNLEKCALRWCEDVTRTGWGLSEETLFSADSFLDWTASAVARHASGAPIRDLAALSQSPANPEVFADPARFDVKLSDPAEICAEFLSREADEDPSWRLLWDNVTGALPSGHTIRPHMRQAIEEHLGWQSPYAALAARAAKVTWSEVKRRFDPGHEDAEQRHPDAGKTAVPALGPLVERPLFLQAWDVTPIERGQATHLVLQHLHLAGPLDAASIAGKIREMVERDLLRPEVARRVDARAIARFFRTPLGARTAASPERVRREVPFCLGLPVSGIYRDIAPAVAGNERVLVQGIIDCIIDEPDGFVLIDFKTDAGARHDVEEASSRYGGQIAIYRAAVETIYNRPVKEAYLYFLATGTAVPMDVPGDWIDGWRIAISSGDHDRTSPDDVAESVNDSLDLDGEIP